MDLTNVCLKLFTLVNCLISWSLAGDSNVCSGVGTMGAPEAGVPLYFFET